jgi:imidazolonepropionase-like amidohydrolase
MKSLTLHALAMLLACFAATIAEAKTLVIYAGQVIVDARQPILGPSRITIVDDKIVAIESSAQPLPAIPTDAIEIDARDLTVLPGLIDAHVHLSSGPGKPYWRDAVETDEYATLIGAKNAALTINAGFTTVRDVGSAPNVGFALRDAIAAGLISGPRILASGPAISIIGGHGDFGGFRPEIIAALSYHNTCTGAVECAARVREASRAGADLIKMTATGGVLSQSPRGLESQFSNDELQAIVTTAHSLGLKVAAHAHGARGIEAAARAGADSIEHGTFADAAALAAMKSSGSFLVPTLMAFSGVEERIGTGAFTPAVEAKARQTLKVRGQAIAAARRNAVPIAFGTDAGVFEHGRNAREFGLLVRYGGLSPSEALASATTDAARLLGLQDEIGRIAPAMRADLIAVRRNPLQNVQLLEQVQLVIAAGKVVRAPSLNPAR